MLLLLFFMFGFFHLIIAPDGTGGTNWYCEQASSKDGCLGDNPRYGTCAWCFSNQKCCKFDICGNTTDCNCHEGQFTPNTSMTCEEYRNQVRIITIVFSTIGGIIGLCLLICCLMYLTKR